MSGTPVSKEVHYRHRSDTGTVDAAPTWHANEDTSAAITVGTAWRIRAAVENTGTGSDTISTIGATASGGGIIRCGYAAAAWSGLANVINGADAGASADATAVTVQRLTSGTGSFANGVYDENETMSQAVANGNFTEVETGLVMTGGASTQGVGGGETWTCRYDGLTDAPTNTITWTTPETNGTNFQHGNQLGGAGQLVANSATISMTTAADIRANNLVVVAVVCDNNGTTDADHSEISGVTCGGVNMTKAVEFTNGNAAAQAGVTTSIWWLQHGSQINSGSSITATFTTASTSGDANAISAREFVVGSGLTVTVAATNSAVADGANAPSVDATTANVECLRVCAHGSEGGQTLLNAVNQVRASNNTWSLWWTSGALMRGSANNTTATNVAVAVEASISTGTGAASQIGAYSATLDWASVYAAFRADAAGDGQPIVKRAGGVEFMHSLGRHMGKHIKVWFQGLMGGELAHG